MRHCWARDAPGWWSCWAIGMEVHLADHGYVVHPLHWPFTDDRPRVLGPCPTLAAAKRLAEKTAREWQCEDEELASRRAAWARAILDAPLLE
jgi:hypothetical protein